MRPLPRRPSQVVLIAAVAAAWSCEERRERPPLPPEGDGTGNVVATAGARGEPNGGPNGTSVNPTSPAATPSMPNGSELTDASSASLDPRASSTTEGVTLDTTSSGSVTGNTRSDETPVTSSVDETLHDAGALEDSGTTGDMQSEQLVNQ